MTIVALLIGLVAGLALGVTGVLFALRERMQSGTGALARTSELEVEARGFERRAIEAEAQLAAERGSLDERVAGAVRAASTAAMKESSGAFLDLAQTKLDAYVAPLRESLGKVETQVNALESARKEAYGSLDRGRPEPSRGPAASPERDEQPRHRPPCSRTFAGGGARSSSDGWWSSRGWSSTAISSSSRRRTTARGVCSAPTSS